MYGTVIKEQIRPNRRKRLRAARRPAGNNSVIAMEPPIYILVVEAVASDVILLAHELRRAGLTCTLERVETEPEFRRGLARDPGEEPAIDALRVGQRTTC